VLYDYLQGCDMSMRKTILALIIYIKH